MSHLPSALSWILVGGLLLAAGGAVFSAADRPPDDAGTLREAVLKRSASPAAASEEILERIRQGRQELATLDGSHFRESVTAILVEAELFEEWARLVGEVLEYRLRPDQARLVAAFQAELEAAQRTEYPALRQAFTEAVRTLPWAEELEIAAAGDASEVLYLASGHYSESGLRRLARFRLAESLVRLRFRQIHIGESGGKEVDIPVPGQPDDAIVFWTEVGRTVVVASRSRN